MISKEIQNFIHNEISFLQGERILITGGTGSFGQAFVRRILKEHPASIIIFSRHEDDQWEMAQRVSSPVVRYVIGDVRDRDSIDRAFRGVDYVIHAAALKHVATGEEQPEEAKKTNIDGACNIIRAAIDQNVKKVLCVSSDKAVNPVSLYGATKLVADKLFIGANRLGGPIFSVIRFGNFWDSHGSVVKIFRKYKEDGLGYLPVHDRRMTRFHITLERAAELALQAFKQARRGGEIFSPKMSSYSLLRLAHSVYPEAEIRETGKPVGAKLHEDLVVPNDADRTWEYDDFYVTYPRQIMSGQGKGKKVPKQFWYSSDKNTEWLKDFKS